jgi:signal transduction histidine kinase
MDRCARILVVDDDESVAITVQAVLEQEGYDVRVAFSAEEARSLLGEQQFDVALLDLRIDDADGIELMAEIRVRQPDCTTIMLTGYGSLESAIRAIREGAYDYLLKPCDLDELKLTIARAIERSELRRALNERVLELEAANATIGAFNDELQNRIDAATAELKRTVDDLRAAKQTLERTHRQRLEFVSMVAHEFGQPLTSIVGFAQLLGRSTATAERREQALSVILAETRRLTRLVKDLGDVARLSSGRFSIDPVAADVGEIVAEQVELAQQTAGAHTVRLLRGGGALPALLDRDRIAQVVSNLLTNAVRYTPGGTITVQIGVDDGCARLSVSDEGPGLPSDRLDEIFEPHVRLVASESGPRPAGTGLGLYISRGIVEAHGGRIWAENGAGGGATFTVTVPLSYEPSTNMSIATKTSP